VLSTIFLRLLSINFKEITTVYYDAPTINIEEMEDALRKAKTYQGTVK